MKLHLRQYSMLPVTSSWVRPPIIIQLNKAAGCGGPLPARRFPGSGVARLIFLGHMVSGGIQGLGLSDDLLKHFKRWLRQPSAVRRPSFWHS